MIPAELHGVLHALSQHPGLPHRLRNPQNLETYLRKARPEDEAQMFLPDSQETSEDAELAPLVENWLPTLKESQVSNLPKALGTLSQEISEQFQTLTPFPKRKSAPPHPRLRRTPMATPARHP